MLPLSEDIMGVEHNYHMDDFMAQIAKLPALREARLPGARAPRSRYDR